MQGSISMSTRAFFRLWLPLFLAAAVVFMAFPGIDIAVTRLAWGGRYDVWPLNAAQWAHDLRWWVGRASWLPLVAVGAGAVAGLLRLRRPDGFDLRGFVFLALTYILGPGLLVNTLLKVHWGRARPYAVAEFGGDERFTAALMPSDAGGAAFVSGEASLAAAACAAAWLLAGPWRTAAWIYGLALTATMTWLRIAQGGHFLSDCVFAALFTLLCAWFAYVVVYRVVPVAHGAHPGGGKS